jgi:hypothetical protein
VRVRAQGQPVVHHSRGAGDTATQTTEQFLTTVAAGNRPMINRMSESANPTLTSPGSITPCS